MDFLLYEPEDFVCNESYLRYYFRLHEVDVTFWQQWISNNPEKLDCIVNADHLIGLLSLQLDESDLAQEFQKLQSALNNQYPAEDNGVPQQGIYHSQQVQPCVSRLQSPMIKTRRLSQLGLAAACFAIALIATYIYFSPLRKGAQEPGLATMPAKHLQVKVNNGTESLKFRLEDGTIITLQPGSVLNYPSNFLPEKREVFLDGEAFFEVSKNKKRPFYVYCQNLVAHVLGTSFNIKTDKLHGKIEVAVSTGKVEVYENNIEVAASQNNKSNGLILTPNQKAIYLEDDKKFESSLVDVPLPISYTEQDTKKDSSLPEMAYVKPTPMSEILRSLVKDYGIDIEVENENLNNCHFSGPLPDMNLYLKLDALCQMVNASYEVKGTKILIRGIGCN